MLYHSLGGGLASETPYSFSTYVGTRAISPVDLLNGGGLLLDWNRSGGGFSFVDAEPNLRWPGVGGGPTNPSGYTILEDGHVAPAGGTRASWALREERNRIKLIRYTGNGAVNRPLAHGFSSAPTAWILFRASDGQIRLWSAAIPHFFGPRQSALYLLMNTNGNLQSANNDQRLAPDATNIYVSSAINTSGVSYVMAALMPAVNEAYSGTGAPQTIRNEALGNAGLTIVKHTGYREGGVTATPANPNWLVYEGSGDLQEYSFFNQVAASVSTSGLGPVANVPGFYTDPHVYLALGFAL